MPRLQRLLRNVLVSCFLVATPAAIFSAELPQHYFKLMEAELKALDTNSPRSNPGAMFAAAVLYSKQHPANPAFGDEQKLALALKLGDLFAEQSAADTSGNMQDYEWEMHFWLDTFRLLNAQLGTDRRARWQREIEKITRWFVGQVAYRIDYPRYQGPYIRTSTNHLALFASEVYLA